jgi:hypothetical protein
VLKEALINTLRETFCKRVVDPRFSQTLFKNLPSCPAAIREAKRVAAGQERDLKVFDGGLGGKAFPLSSVLPHEGGRKKSVERRPVGTFLQKASPDIINQSLLKIKTILAVLPCAFIAFAGEAAAGSAGYMGMSLKADFRPFSADSPWNTAIAPGAKVDKYSDLMIKNMKERRLSLKADSAKWSIPLFVIDSTKSPKADVKSATGAFPAHVDPDGDGTARGLPIPDGVWPDPEKDGHMLLVDPLLKKSWDFSRVKRRPGGADSIKWSATRVDTWDLNGPGFREAFTGARYWELGARGSGFPLLAGLIRIEEMEAGRIEHALVVATPVNLKSTAPGGGKELCSPASRTDGTGVGPEFIPMGARLQLDPALDVDSLNLSAGTRIIARALQKYGAYVADGSPTLKLYLQNLGPGDAAWEKYGRFKDLKNIPVERFRVLECKRIGKKGN